MTTSSFIRDNALAVKLISSTVIVLMAMVFASFFYQQFPISRDSLELLTLINWLLVCFLLAINLPKGIWSICFIYFMAFSIFHGGLVFVSALNLVTDSEILRVIQYWYHLPETDIAIFFINFTMLIYALACILFSQRVENTHISTGIGPTKRLYHISGLMLCAMILIFFLVGAATGALSSYGAYLSAMKNQPMVSLLFVYIYLFIGLFLIIVSVSYKPGFGYLYFVVFGVWAAIAFKIGLRGEVMFPAAASAAMFSRQRIPISTIKLGALVVLMLIATVIVKNARVSGNYSEIENINPLNAIAEMGSSIRTIQEVIKWRKQDFPELLGASYWAPFERQLALFLPIKRPPAMEDKRLLNVVVMEKAGPIGFSPIAEAYVNFGEKGIIIVSIVLGVLFARLDSLPSRVTTDIFIGVSIVPLFVMIRNSFTFIPVQVIIGLVIAFGILQLAKVRINQYEVNDNQ